MSYPDSYRYTKDHEWIDASGANPARIGITEHAQGELGDVVYVEPPESGKDLGAGDVLCAIESVKAQSDIYIPVAGTVKSFNAELEGAPELVNSDAHGAGWIVEVEIKDASELEGLMSAADYQKMLEG